LHTGQLVVPSTCLFDVGRQPLVTPPIRGRAGELKVEVSRSCDRANRRPSPPQGVMHCDVVRRQLLQVTLLVAWIGAGRAVGHRRSSDRRRSSLWPGGSLRSPMIGDRKRPLELVHRACPLSVIAAGSDGESSSSYNMRQLLSSRQRRESTFRRDHDDRTAGLSANVNPVGGVG